MEIITENVEQLAQLIQLGDAAVVQGMDKTYVEVASPFGREAAVTLVAGTDQMRLKWRGSGQSLEDALLQALNSVSDDMDRARELGVVRVMSDDGRRWYWDAHPEAIDPEAAEKKAALLNRDRVDYLNDEAVS
jgi:5-deoxy-D-glucuronate isomerase